MISQEEVSGRYHSGTILAKDNTPRYLADILGNTGDKVGDIPPFTAVSTNETAKQDVIAPDPQPRDGAYAITVINGVAQSITVNLYTKEGADYSPLTSFTVPAYSAGTTNGNRTIPVQGWMLSGAGAISVTPAAAGSGNITVSIRRM